jgi:small-conductance mechanosensitive channel
MYRGFDMPFIDTVFLGNSVRQWVIALGLGVVAFLAVRLTSGFARARLARLAGRTKTSLDDIAVYALDRTTPLFAFALAIAVVAGALRVPAEPRRFVHGLIVVLLLFQVGRWLSAGFGAWLEHYTRRELQNDPGAATTASALGFVARVALWSVLVLLCLDNLGFNITTLMAGLGVGGVAVALAVQNILGDLFASLSIVLDKPFVLGDFITVGDMLGSVEHIGLKTTRIRSLGGEQIVFSNSDLLGSRLRNYGRMAQRRVLFTIGVTYETPRALLQRIPEMLREAVEAQARTRFDRAHFKEYGDFALSFEIVYYVLDPDYNLYMDTQQAINFRIHERFEAAGIEFAFPTQTLHLVRDAAPAT